MQSSVKDGALLRRRQARSAVGEWIRSKPQFGKRAKRASRLQFQKPYAAANALSLPLHSVLFLDRFKRGHFSGWPGCRELRQIILGGNDRRATPALLYQRRQKDFESWHA